MNRSIILLFFSTIALAMEELPEIPEETFELRVIIGKDLMQALFNQIPKDDPEADRFTMEIPIHSTVGTIKKEIFKKIKSCKNRKEDQQLWKDYKKRTLYLICNKGGQSTILDDDTNLGHIDDSNTRTFFTITEILVYGQVFTSYI